MQHRLLVIRPNPDLNLVRWGVAMLRNCTIARAVKSTKAAWCGWPGTAAIA